MLINADFSSPAIVKTREQAWVASPQAGVERIMLDRIGAEKARATSIVRYAPDSFFPRHQHPGGEEILVLSGTFCDEHGQYDAGWYIRNPPQSGHQPYSEEGATIFVKLWQMSEEGQTTVRIDTRDPARWQQMKDREVCPLFGNDHEVVCLQRLPARTRLFDQCAGGAEILVLEGQLYLGGLVSSSTDMHEAGTWIRLPEGYCPEVVAGDAGATCYVKTGHLASTSKEAAACRQDR